MTLHRCFLHMLKPTVAACLLLLSLSPLLHSQGLVLENNPATLKWNEIVTPHFNILFPQGLEQEGQRMARTLEHLHGPVSKSLGKEPRPIPIVLQNQGMISNGFVSLGPRRSEFFTAPPHDYKFLGNNDWMNVLAVHEFRHIVQFDKSISGLSKLAYWVLGEDILAGLAFISTPLWFWEGDAVGIETALSSSGRGRIPYFQALHRANVLDRGGYKYQKQYLRSYKDQVPNHYLTGYLMTTFLRRTYGSDVLNRVTQRSFSLPIIPFTFSRALKKETGLNLVKNYNLMSQEMDSLYRRQVAALQLTKFESLQKERGKLYTEYAYPQLTQDGNLLAVRYGIGDISQLVQQTEDGQWKVLHTLGVWEDNGYLSAGGNKVAWNEIMFHPRWERRSYSAIKIFDLQSGKTTTLGRRERYKGAGLSPDGSRVVTVENSLDNSFQILVLDAESGAVLQRLLNPGNHFYSMPRFSADGQSIVALKHNAPQKAIVSIDLKTGFETEWLSSATENLGHPIMTGEWLIYASDVTGLDNLFALNLATRKAFQITSSRLGAYNPTTSADNGWLYYNEMTKDGWDVVRLPFDPSAFVPMTDVAIDPINYFEPLVTQENQPDILETVPDTTFGVRRYRQFKHLVRPIGWGWVNTLSDRQIELGIYSQNILSTMYLDAGYNFHLTEGTGFWTANVSYQGLPVIFDVGYLNGTRSVYEQVGENTQLYTWDEQGVNGGIRIPLQLTHSRYRENASMSAMVSSTQIDNYVNPVFDIDQQRNGALYSTQYNLTYSRLLKQSKRDIYPRLGQSIALNYFDTPFSNSDYLSSLWSGESYIYLPGLFKHHSFRLRAAYQNEAINNYRFRSEIQNVRGFGYTSFNNLTTLSANYALPLLYPDLALGNMLYIQRVRANAFYDFGHGTTDNLAKSFDSVGIDVFFDYNVMRFLPVFSTGVRVVYVPEQDTYVIRLLLGSLAF